MLHLLYALLATARSSLKLRRELALQTLASRQQLTIVLRTTSDRATHPSVEGWTRSGFTRSAIAWVLPSWLDCSDCGGKSPAEAGLSDGGDPNDAKLEPTFRFH
jgi:hypothetical protein